MQRTNKILIGSLGFVVLLILWHWASSRPDWNHFLFPAPAAVFQRMIRLTASGVLFSHISASLMRVFSGFGISICVAFPIGAALALCLPFAVLVRPMLDFARQIPPLAMVPLLILSFGIGEASRVAVVVMASFFPILLNTENGIRQVDRRLLEVGKTLSFSRTALFYKIMFPAFFPYFFVGIRLALSYSWRSLVGAEIVAASSGIGYMIREAEALSRSDTIICGILVLGFIGALSDFLLNACSLKLFPWSRLSENDKY